jgi:non-heme chloroperoxidase
MIKPVWVFPLIALLLAPVVILGGMIAFGTKAPPPPLASITEPFRHVDFSDLPQIKHMPARDGTPLAYRVWPARANDLVLIAVHGSSAHSVSLHPLGKALAAAGVTVYAPDIRGHGGSGAPGDINDAGQIDDDMTDFVAAVRAQQPKARLVLLGFSSGGGFALHIAATPLGRAFDRAVLLSPMLGARAPTARADGNAWVAVDLPRIIALSILNTVGIHAFDGLPVLAFAIAPENPGKLTRRYSFRLLKAFATGDYAADLRNAHCPLAVLVGAKDELFAAARFAPTVHAVRADIPVMVVPGLGHIAMTTDARALPAILAAIRGTP